MAAASTTSSKPVDHDAKNPSVAKDGYTSTDPAEGADQELQDLGYAPELARTKSTVGIICMTFILTAMPYGSSSSLYYPLINGGSSTVVWGFLLVSLIMVCLAASLAEITSVYPTAGGVYYQTFMLGSLQWRRIAAWICGWSFVLGTVIICLSVGFGFTLYLIACVNVFDTSDGSPFWEPETYQVFLIFLAFTLLCNATSVLGNARLHILDSIAVAATVLGLLATTVCSLALAKGGHRSAKYVFTSFEPLSGWAPGWAFCVGLLQGAYTGSGTGMITSMCEEASDPGKQVPKAMVAVTSINAVVGTLYMIALMFVLPDLEMLVNLPSGQPLPTIIKTAVGSSAAAFVLNIPLLILIFVCMVGCTTSASRCVWAFSRDGGIPGSPIWKRVNPKFDLPINAIILSMTAQILLGFIYFGSTAAFNAFIGSGVIFLTVSYTSPVVISVLGRRREVSRGQYHLGKLGAFCNAVTICWTVFAIPVFCMPTYLPVTSNSMNYASPVFFGFTLMAAAWYWAWGKDHYRGPPVEIYAVSSVPT